MSAFLIDFILPWEKHQIFGGSCPSNWFIGSTFFFFILVSEIWSFSSFCFLFTIYCQSFPPILEIHAILRDFSDQHPDFESFLGSELEIVAPTLGADNKPFLNPSKTSWETIDSLFFFLEISNSIVVQNHSNNGTEMYLV